MPHALFSLCSTGNVRTGERRGDELQFDVSRGWRSRQPLLISTDFPPSQQLTSISILHRREFPWIVARALARDPAQLLRLFHLIANQRRNRAALSETGPFHIGTSRSTPK